MTLPKIVYRLPQYTARVALPLMKFPEPPTLKGAGMVTRFPEVMATTGIRQVLVVCGPTVYASGMLSPFLDALEANGIVPVVFHGVSPNPTFKNVYAAIEMYQSHFCDSVVAFGGGSAIDCAKITAAKITNDKPIERMAGLFRLAHRLPPFFAVPTTAGSGSEASIAAVVTNEERHKKLKMADAKLCPLAVVLDPELTRSMSADVTAYAGMDALTHAVEAYIGLFDTPYVREKSLDASRRILAALPKAFDDPDDLDARLTMQEAAMDAGKAFTRAMVGYVHAIAHAVGGLYNLSHGLACAAILPRVLAFSKPAATQKLAELAYNAELGGPECSDEELADALIAEIEAMNRRFGIPRTLDALRVEDIPELARLTLAEANPVYPVPRIMDYNDCIELLGKLLPEDKTPRY